MSAPAPVAAVLGWPIGHSRSPALHGHWLRRYGLAGWYVPLAVAPERFEGAFRQLGALGLKGANVTVPHKEAAFNLVDRLTDRARRIGAVNTVHVEADGALTGDNTDGFGFIENLRQSAPNWSAAAGPALILGAGGAARAVAASLIDAGAPMVTLANRTAARAEALAAALGGPARAAAWDDRAALAAEAALIVNTTTLGMNDGATPLPAARFQPGALATDIVYAPLETPFLAAARAAGADCVDGLGMLLHQARPGFERWFGRAPEVDAQLRAAVLAA